MNSIIYTHATTYPQCGHTIHDKNSNIIGAFGLETISNHFPICENCWLTPNPRGPAATLEPDALYEGRWYTAPEFGSALQEKARFLWDRVAARYSKSDRERLDLYTDQNYQCGDWLHQMLPETHGKFHEILKILVSDYWFNLDTDCQLSTLQRRVIVQLHRVVVQQHYTTSRLRDHQEILASKPEALALLLQGSAAGMKAVPLEDIGEEDRECRICSNEYGTRNDGVIETAVELPCGHQFGGWCITEWFSRSKRSCPYCRSVVPGPGRALGGMDLWDLDLEGYSEWDVQRQVHGRIDSEGWHFAYAEWMFEFFDDEDHQQQEELERRACEAYISSRDLNLNLQLFWGQGLQRYRRCIWNETQRIDFRINRSPDEESEEIHRRRLVRPAEFPEEEDEFLQIEAHLAMVEALEEEGLGVHLV